jgi:hypothetical protein
MSKNVALMLAAFMLVSLFSFDAEALPGLPAAQPSSPNVTLVRGFCGLGFHREYGHCIRNGTAYVPPVVVTPHVVVTPPVVVAPHYAPHVVVAPHYTTPVVVAPSVCPHGYYHGANGHCLPY